MESQASISNMIQFSWAKSREILFPFNFKRWFKILIMVWLAGVGIQGFTANFNAPSKTARPSFAPPKFTMPKLPPPMLPQGAGKKLGVSSAQTSTSIGISDPSQEQAQVPAPKEMQPRSVSQDTDRIAKLRANRERPKFKTNPTLVVLLVAGTVLLGMGFAVFFIGLSSRFNFVLLDAIVTRGTAIRESFKRHKEAGNSYFVWTLLFLAISLGVFILAGLILVLSLGIAKWKLAIGIPVGIFGGLLALAALGAMIFVGIVMRDFALPLMYRERIPAMNALNKFMEADSFAFRKVFQYFLVVLGLWIVALIVQSIVSVLLAIGGLIAGGIVVLPGILLIKALPFLTVPLILFGGFVAVAIVLAVIVAIGMLMLPGVIFFRVFALTYLTRLYPECDLLGFLGTPS